MTQMHDHITGHDVPQPVEPRFALPDTDLLNGDPVLQIALLHEGNVPIVVDIDLDTSVVSDLRADVTLLDVCREVKRMRLAGNLPPVQVIMFYTSFPDSNDPAPRLMWLYDRDALANRTLMCDADYVHATFETWAIVPSEG